MTRNFAYPYFSTNIKDFWHRWHISLSTWFREYLYIPLGGNRLGPRRTALNAFIVFVVSGFWHGANWTFVIWGILHGLYFLIYTQWIEKPKAMDGGGRNIAALLGRLGATLVTFHLVCLAWVFFRADSASTAFTILGKMPGCPSMAASSAPRSGPCSGSGCSWPSSGSSAPASMDSRSASSPQPMRWAIYYATVCIILVFCYLDYAPFIYFQF